MAKQKGDMYEWVRETWNPIIGKCGFGCCYCYMKRWDGVLPPEIRIQKQAMNKRKLPPGNVFVCSSLDLFHPDIPDELIQRVIDKARTYPDATTFLFQSKNPGRMLGFDFPENSILCTTMETDSLPPGVSKAPPIHERAEAIGKLKQAGNHTMITLEPLIVFHPEAFLGMLIESNPNQINIGGRTGIHGRDIPEPDAAQVEWLISELTGHFGTDAIHLKDNIHRLRTTKKAA